MLACGGWVGNIGQIPVYKHSALNLRFRAKFIVADDQYITGANVSMKNANVKSGFVSYNTI
jgi:hypothetical protein